MGGRHISDSIARSTLEPFTYMTPCGTCGYPVRLNVAGVSDNFLRFGGTTRCPICKNFHAGMFGSGQIGLYFNDHFTWQNMLLEWPYSEEGLN